MGDLSLDALLKFLSSSGVTGTLTIVTAEGRGELDLEAGRVIGAWSQDSTGEPALRAIFATPPRAVAERSRLIVLHYDADFDLIANVTRQKTEWVAPEGSL